MNCFIKEHLCLKCANQCTAYKYTRYLKYGEFKDIFDNIKKEEK